MSCNIDEASLRRPTKYALHDAAEVNDVTRLSALIAAEPGEDDVILDINEKDPAGCTPLHVAILNSALESAKELLLRGASIKARCNGSPVLHLLLAMGAIPRNAEFVARMLPLLLALEPDLSATDDSGRTALHTCSGLGLLSAAQLIFKKGIPELYLVATDKFGSSALHAAAAGKHKAMVQWLLVAGCSASDADGVGDTPAHAAAKAGWQEGMELLLSAAASAKAKEGEVITAPASASSNESFPAGEVDVHMGGDAPVADATPADGYGPVETVNTSAPLSGGAVPDGPRNWQGLTPRQCLMPLLPAQSGSASTSGACAPPHTLVLTHAVCADHYTCAHPIARTAAYVPPENTLRLDTLLNPLNGTLRTADLVPAATAAAESTPLEGDVTAAPADGPDASTQSSTGSGSVRSAASTGVELRYDAPRAQISDVLRVHDYEYVRRILNVVGTAQPASNSANNSSDSSPSSSSSSSAVAPPKISHLDSDTAVSASSWEAALRAAGAVCAAADRVISGQARNAFCPVRPPGHHAGPRGIVLNPNDEVGTHGFCLLNNVAIAAAYVRAVYGRTRYSDQQAPASSSPAVAAAPPVIRRVAIFDFDVHHGNGTEAVVRQLVPTETVKTVRLPFGNGCFSVMSYKPWLDESDGSDVMFISSHGYGLRDPTKGEGADNPWFYPGSGAPAGYDGSAVERAKDEAAGAAAKAKEAEAAAAAAAASASSSSSESLEIDVTAANGSSTSSASDPLLASPSSKATAAAESSSSSAMSPTPTAVKARRRPAAQAIEQPTFASLVEETGEPSKLSLQPTSVPEGLFEAGVRHPHIINVGLRRGLGPKAWRRIMTADVLPRLAAFKPDLIFISAGFDAHHKDGINWGYVGLREEDYAWITAQLVKVANACCDGRVVSVLEGGYRIQGRIISPFGRSVAAHLRALASRSAEAWDTGAERRRLLAELQAEKAAEEAAAAAAALATAAKAAAAAGSGSSRPRLSMLSIAKPRIPAALSSATTPAPLTVTSSSASVSDVMRGGGPLTSSASPQPTPISAALTAARAAALAAAGSTESAASSGVSGDVVGAARVVTFDASSLTVQTSAGASDISVTSGGSGTSSSVAAVHLSAFVSDGPQVVTSGGGATTAPAPADSTSAGDAGAGADGGSASSRRGSKRRRSAANIDFAALDAQLRAEEESAKQRRIDALAAAEAEASGGHTSNGDSGSGSGGSGANGPSPTGASPMA